MSENQAYHNLRNVILYDELRTLKNKLMGIAFEKEKTDKQYSFGVWKAIAEIDERIEKIESELKEEHQKIIKQQKELDKILDKHINENKQ